MQKITIVTCALLLLINVVAHFIFPSYSSFNCGVSSIIVVIGMALTIIVANTKMKDAFRYSLNTIIPTATLIEFVICIIGPDRMVNNYCVIISILLIVVQLILLFVANHISKSIN